MCWCVCVFLWVSDSLTYFSLTVCDTSYLSVSLSVCISLCHFVSLRMYDTFISSCKQPNILPQEFFNPQLCVLVCLSVSLSVRPFVSEPFLFQPLIPSPVHENNCTLFRRSVLTLSHMWPRSRSPQKALIPASICPPSPPSMCGLCRTSLMRA